MKVLRVLFLVLILSSFAWADSYESITITHLTGGVPLSASIYGAAKWGMCRLESAEIRYTLDGATTPTNLIGVVLEPLEWVVLEKAIQIKNFRGFATGNTPGNLKCFYFE
jgi:hypothetical protein